MPLSLLPLLALHLSAAPARAVEEVCYESANADGEIIVVAESLEFTCAVELADGRLIQIFAEEDTDTCQITSDAADGGGTITVICPPTRLAAPNNNDVLIWPT